MNRRDLLITGAAFTLSSLAAYAQVDSDDALAPFTFHASDSALVDLKRRSVTLDHTTAMDDFR
jgi:hypothetical protein